MQDAIADTPWPELRAVAHLPGSLPMGGVVPDTPVHAFAHTPEALQLDPAAAVNQAKVESAKDFIISMFKL